MAVVVFLFDCDHLIVDRKLQGPCTVFHLNFNNLCCFTVEEHHCSVFRYKNEHKYVPLNLLNVSSSKDRRLLKTKQKSAKEVFLEIE